MNEKVKNKMEGMASLRYGKKKVYCRCEGVYRKSETSGRVQSEYGHVRRDKEGEQKKSLGQDAGQENKMTKKIM